MLLLRPLSIVRVIPPRRTDSRDNDACGWHYCAPTVPGGLLGGAGVRALGEALCRNCVLLSGCHVCLLLGRVAHLAWALACSGFAIASSPLTRLCLPRTRRPATRRFADEAVVVTQSGPVRGKIVENARLFLGIPYARPPVDTLRWSDPRCGAARDAALARPDLAPHPAQSCWRVGSGCAGCHHHQAGLPSDLHAAAAHVPHVPV